MHTSSKRLHDGDTIRRMLQFLRAIDEFKGEWFSLTMVVKQTGLPKTTAYRYLTVFVEEGVLERHLYLRAYRRTLEQEEKE